MSTMSGSEAQGLEPETYARVEEHLSSEGIFLMGDAQKQGFPIRFASEGFEQLYGYDGSEICMKKCGDLIGGPMILANRDVLTTACAMSQMPPEEVEARIRFLNEKAGEACRVMVAHPDERVGVALLLNRKKSGELFCCECLILCLQHPSLNWSYTVGFQRDISRDVSVQALMASCSPGEYNRLLQSRAGALEERRSVLLGVGGQNVVQYLHEKALSVFSLDIWRSLRSELISSAPGTAGSAGSAGPAGAQPAPAPQPESVSLTPPTNALVPNGSTPAAAQQSGQLMGPVAPAQPQAFAPMQQAAAPLACYQQNPGELSLQASAPRFQGQAPAAHKQLPRIDQQWEHMKVGSNQTLSFLADVGLHNCAEPLLLNGYDDIETMLDMTEEDMHAIGLTRGHASKLKRRLRSLKCMQICAGEGAGGAPTLLQTLYSS